MPTASPGSRSTSPARSANVLSRDVLVELGTLLERARSASRRARSIVRSGKPSGFIAGADIKEFTGLQQRDRCLRADPHRPAGARPARGLALPHGRGHPRLRAGRRPRARPRLPLSRRASATSACPWACPRCSSAFIPDSAARCASVRLIGVRPAMELMLTGRPVRADKALQLGLVDRLVPAAELEAAARKMALKPPAAASAAVRRAAAELADRARRSSSRSCSRRWRARRKREHYPAPYAIVDLWAAARRARQAGVRSRSALHRAAVHHRDRPQAGARIPAAGPAEGPGRHAAAPTFKHVHVVGAGVMGGDIAAWCALRGLTVTLQDRGDGVHPARARARARAVREAPDAIPARAREARERLRADVEGDGVPRSRHRDRGDLRESRGQARAVCAARAAHETERAPRHQHLEHHARAAGRASWRDPERLVGLHFFNPVAQMPLVEIVQRRAHGRRPSRRPRSSSRASSTSCRCPAAARRASSSTAC